MTLRELLKNCRYKPVFNSIYKHYYKDKAYTTIKMMDIDSSYQSVWKTLAALPPNDPKECRLELNICTEGDDHFYDITMIDGKEVYALAFCPWSDLIDMPVSCPQDVHRSVLLSHILWEITFWGFTQIDIEKQKKITENATNDKTYHFSLDELL